MIKWEHSVLTLPFGLTGAVLAARGIPSLHTSIWIIVALVAARSAAMAFNRLVDATIDAVNPRILILTAAVVFWGAGFDILYSCQDFDFDCSTDVYSVPKAFGISTSLNIARLFHLMTVLLLAWMVVAFGLGKMAVAGVVFVALLLIYEHSLVKHDDLSRVNAAFFTMNGLISMAFLFFIAGDLMLAR